VEEALRAVGERFDFLDKPNPLKVGRQYTPRYKALIDSFKKDDPEPSRVWPVTITILAELWKPGFSHVPHTPQFFNLARNLAVLAYFFLCRTGEYAKGNATEDVPFRFCDVFLSTPIRTNIRASDASLHDVNQAVAVLLEFTEQKNSVKGERIGHIANGHSILCPVQAAKEILRPLVQHTAPPETSLHELFTEAGSHGHVNSSVLTGFLRAAAARVQHITGIPPDKITAYSLRSGGATALLCSGADAVIIQLVGRWRSDAMLRYLRVQANNITNDHSQAMLKHGAYTFLNSIAQPTGHLALLPDNLQQGPIADCVLGDLLTGTLDRDTQRRKDPFAPDLLFFAEVSDDSTAETLCAYNHPYYQPILDDDDHDVYGDLYPTDFTG